jgi:hypothetical protein
MADNFANVTNAELLGGMYGPNPYSQFQGRMPFPGYVGTPTDALGRPIQQAPGTTLNQTQAQPQAAAPAAAPQQHWGMTSAGGQVTGGAAGGEGAGMSGATGGTNIPAQYGWLPGPGPGQQPQAPAAPQSPGAAPGSLNTALAALSNPGPVTTPGATVPQSTIGSQPNVLQQFLANQKGGTGAANYSNQGFFNTLNALGGGQ